MEDDLKIKINILNQEKINIKNNLNKRIENLNQEKINIKNNLNRRIEILNQEKNEIEYNLNRRIENLNQEKNDIENNLNTEIEKLKQQNNNIKINSITDINELKDKIKILATDINHKYQQINYYKSQIEKMSQLKNDISLNKPGEKIFSVIFMTEGNDDIKNYAMTVKNTDTFYSLEETLYNDFPEYKKLKLMFMVNTNEILRFKTLEENKIKHNDIIHIFINEFEK